MSVCLLVNQHSSVVLLPDFQWNQTDCILFITHICLDLTSSAALA